jgi:hypothetical protein
MLEMIETLQSAFWLQAAIAGILHCGDVELDGRAGGRGPMMVGGAVDEGSVHASVSL